jgi:hypothetical protein
MTTTLTESVTIGVEPAIASIGITGSRTMPTPAQKYVMSTLVNALCLPGSELHHGCCIGTDETAHFIAARIPRVRICGHPGYGRNQSSPYRMNSGREIFAVMHAALPYAQRNRAIVEACITLLAFPLYPEDDSRSLHSGTWQTVRIARRLRKPVIRIPPDGQSIHESNRDEKRGNVSEDDCGNYR